MIEKILHRGLGRSGFGPKGYDPLLLFKCLLLGQWHGLSEPSLERSLRVRLDFMLFCGLDLHSNVPDETTHCRFRNALVKANVYDDLLDAILVQLEDHGLKMREAEAALVDATLIQSAARPKTFINAPQDRLEGDTPDEPDIHYSADPDARWIKKGGKSVLGYKGFARTDDEGYVEKVHTTPANKGESPEFEAMIEGANANRILSDKGNASRANRQALKGRYRDGIMRKAARGRPLRTSEKRFNKLISKKRFGIEQTFGTMKRLFGLHRARYFGLSKVHAQMVMAAIATNLTKAINKISLKPIKQTI